MTGGKSNAQPGAQKLCPELFKLIIEHKDF